jgi:hypothetical protein
MSRPARVVIMATALCVPVVATAVAAWFLPTVAAAGIMVATAAAAFTVVLKVVDPAGTRSAGFAAGCVVAGAIAAMIGAPLLILHTRGEHTRATVTAERVSSAKSGPTYKYRLAAPDGRKIPGELAEPDDEFDVGDQVTVVFDPRGVANPHDTDFAGLGLPLAGATLALLVAAVVLCVPATAERPRPRPPATAR